MGHEVRGLLAATTFLQSFAASHKLHPPVVVAEGLSLLALHEADIDSLVGADPWSSYPGFVHLTDTLLGLLLAASTASPIVYFETEYFGGAGSQGAVALRDGKSILGPTSSSRGPINQALRAIGVRVRAPASDEFETVGLQRHRLTEDWIAAGLPGTDREKEHFLELIDRLAKSDDEFEKSRLKDELARLTFGE